MSTAEKKLLEHLLILKERDDRRKKYSREYYKEYYKTHKEQMLESSKRCNEKHKEKRREANKKRYELNRENIRAYQNTRRAKLKAEKEAKDERQQLEALYSNLNIN